MSETLDALGILPGAVEFVIGQREQRERAQGFFNDPVGWAKYMLDVDLWSKQREVVDSVLSNKSTAVKAGHGVGKSFLSAVLVCWWVDTRYPDCGVATTAPSWDQVNTIIWDEIRKQKAIIEQRFEDGLIDHKLPGYITSEAKWRSYESGQTLAQGRRPPENKEESAFQGLHGRILAIGDEAAGLTGEIIDGLGNITTNEASRRLIIGNPTNPNSYFGKVFKRTTPLC